MSRTSGIIQTKSSLKFEGRNTTVGQIFHRLKEDSKNDDKKDENKFCVSWSHETENAIKKRKNFISILNNPFNSNIKIENLALCGIKSLSFTINHSEFQVEVTDPIIDSHHEMENENENENEENTSQSTFSQQQQTLNSERISENETIKNELKNFAKRLPTLLEIGDIKIDTSLYSDEEKEKFITHLYKKFQDEQKSIITKNQENEKIRTEVAHLRTWKDEMNKQRKLYLAHNNHLKKSLKHLRNRVSLLEKERKLRRKIGKNSRIHQNSTRGVRQNRNRQMYDDPSDSEDSDIEEIDELAKEKRKNLLNLQKLKLKNQEKLKKLKKKHEVLDNEKNEKLKKLRKEYDDLKKKFEKRGKTMKQKGSELKKLREKTKGYEDFKKNQVSTMGKLKKIEEELKKFKKNEGKTTNLKNRVKNLEEKMKKLKEENLKLKKQNELLLVDKEKEFSIIQLNKEMDLLWKKEIKRRNEQLQFEKLKHKLRFEPFKFVESLTFVTHPKKELNTVFGF